MAAKILVLGAGRIASVHAVSINANPALRLAGFVDPAGGDELSARWGVALYRDYATALHKERPDGLVIASPSATHVDYLIKAAAQGLPCLCEKPIGFDRDEIVRAIDEVDSAGISVVLGFHRRFDPARREVLEHVKAGRIGSVEHILQLSRDPQLPPRQVIAHSGGMIADMVVHDLDELLWVTNRMPERIHVRQDRFEDQSLAEFGDFDSTNLMLEWSSGPVAHISASRRAANAFEQRLEVFGGKGRIVCDDPGPLPVRVDDSDGRHEGTRHNHFWDRYRAAYQAEIDNLAECILKNASPICSLQEGLATFDLVKKVVDAASGRP